jgi:hypothetical protein
LSKQLGGFNPPQPPRQFKHCWANYTQNEVKLTRKSENAVNSDHALQFLFDAETAVVNAVVQASMQDTSYRVRVSLAAELLSSPSLFQCFCAPSNIFRITDIAHEARCPVSCAALNFGSCDFFYL